MLSEYNRASLTRSAARLRSVRSMNVITTPSDVLLGGPVRQDAPQVILVVLGPDLALDGASGLEHRSAIIEQLVARELPRHVFDRPPKVGGQEMKELGRPMA